MKDSPSLGKVKLAIDRMASDYPLHAGILAQWHIEADASVQTMGVGFRDGKLRLVYCPAFVENLTVDELVGVIHHESNHVLFEHVFHEPEPGENRSARTIAEEVTVNEWITEPLPVRPVLLSDYPFLPYNEDTDARYAQLSRRVKDNAFAGTGVPGKSRSGNPRSGGGSAPAVQRGGAPTSGGMPRKRKPGRCSANGVPTVDDHGTWAEIANNTKAARAAAKLDIVTTWGNLTKEKKAKVNAPFASIAAGAAEEIGVDGGLGIGTEAGSGASILEGGHAEVPWQSVLRRHVGRVMERRPVFGRPPRRFPDLVGILPGKGRFASKPNVMAVIDTSGSMSTPMLADISAELGVMACQHKVTVVECDTVIHAVYPFRTIKVVQGRGGTDFHPPFDPAFLRKQQPDLVVYFTDGCGPAPSKPPSIPVIWCITEGGRKPVGWGREVLLREPKTGPKVPVMGS